MSKEDNFIFANSKIFDMTVEIIKEECAKDPTKKLSLSKPKSFPCTAVLVACKAGKIVENGVEKPNQPELYFCFRYTYPEEASNYFKNLK